MKSRRVRELHRAIYIQEAHVYCATVDRYIAGDRAQQKRVIGWAVQFTALDLHITVDRAAAHLRSAARLPVMATGRNVDRPRRRVGDVQQDGSFVQEI